MTRNNFFLLIIASMLIGNTVFAQKTALLTAEEFLEKEMIDSAIYHFETALGQNPNNSELQLKLADLYRISNRASKAVLLYENLTKSTSADFLCWYNYAYVLKMEGKYDKCRSVLMQMKSHPDVIGNGSLVMLIEQNINSCDFAIDNKSKIPAFHRIANEKNVNSSASEHSIFLSGNQFVYASNKALKTAGLSDPNSDYIYTANRKNYKELVDEALFHDNNNEKFLAEAADLSPFCFSADRKTIISSSNNLPAGLRQGFNPGNARVYQLSYAEISNFKDLPKLKRIEFANTEANIEAGYPFLSKDGKTLYFASRGKGLEVNYGGFDIYASTLTNGSWSAPKNLGSLINGPGNEICPFIDDAGTIYFASDGHKGFGGLDIFRADPKDANWIDLRNLGFGINSSSDDLNFVLDYNHDLAYFCSNRQGGAGDYDIYSAIKLGDLSMMPKINEERPVNVMATKEVDPKNAIITETYKTEIVKTDNKATNMPIPVIVEEKTPIIIDTKKIEETVASTEKSKTETTLSKIPNAENVYIGSISDASTKEKVEGVWVYVKNKKTGEERKIKTNKYGEYSVVLDAQTQYEIKCSRQGYENFAFEVNTGDGERRTLLSERDMARSANNDVPAEYMLENGLASRSVKSGNAVNETFLRGPQVGKAVPLSGYQIQVGIFKEINPNTQKELSSLANVLSEPYKEGQSKVYKLGVFAEEAHAKEILSKVQAIVGLEKSFIKKVDLQQKTTSEKMNNELMLVYPKISENKTEVKTTVKAEDKSLKASDKSTIKTEDKTTVKTEDKSTVKTEDKTLKASDKSTVKTEDKTTVKTDDKTTVKAQDKSTVKAEDKTNANSALTEYKVQIGAYKDPSKSKLPDLKGIGVQEQVLNKENGLTYIYLKGYKTIDEAKAAVKKAEEKGIVKPFVVGFKDGKKVELKDISK